MFAHGKHFYSGAFKIVWLAGSSTNGLQVGVSVSTRHFKKATDRNRIKRLMKESWRLQKNDLEQVLASQQIGLAVFFIYTAKLMPAYPEVYATFTAAILKLKKLGNA